MAKRLFLSVAILAALLFSALPAESACTITTTKVRGKTSNYSVLALTGTFAGATSFNCSSDSLAPFHAGGVLITVTGDQAGASLDFDVACAGGDPTVASERIIDQGLSGAADSDYLSMFETTAASGGNAACPPGAVVVRLASANASSTGTITATFVVFH